MCCSVAYPDKPVHRYANVMRNKTPCRHIVSDCIVGILLDHVELPFFHIQFAITIEYSSLTFTTHRAEQTVVSILLHVTMKIKLAKIKL